MRTIDFSTVGWCDHNCGQKGWRQKQQRAREIIQITHSNAAKLRTLAGERYVYGCTDTDTFTNTDTDTYAAAAATDTDTIAGANRMFICVLH